MLNSVVLPIHLIRAAHPCHAPFTSSLALPLHSPIDAPLVATAARSLSGMRRAQLAMAIVSGVRPVFPSLHYANEGLYTPRSENASDEDSDNPFANECTQDAL